MISDYHLHTAFSSDSDEDVHNTINAAKKLGMNSICITDHYDPHYPIDPEEPDITFDLDTDAYYNYMRKIREEYSKDFDLRIGVELGLMPHIAEELNQYTASHPELDFIIGSAHLVDNLDPYKPEYFIGKTDVQAYYHYFETILETVKVVKNYNVYGHLDYIMRYGKNKANNFDILDYKNLFVEIFKLLVAQGKGIEINTGGLYKGLDFPHPHIDILKLYKEAGGEIITVGSDAHTANYVGYGFDIAKEQLLDCGFKYYCTFKNQKPEFHSIKD